MNAAVLSVHALTAAERPHWDAFVRACPQATFFHLSAWQALIEEVFRHRCHYLLARRGGEIVAVLPLAEVRSRLFGHSLSSLPFCAYGGIAAADGDDGAVAALEAEAEQLARRLGVQHLEYRNLTARHPEWPAQPLYATFRKPILADVEANLLAIPRKQRAMVRKGMQNGLLASVDEDVERFFALYASNVLRHGTPALPRRYFARLRHTFGDDCEVLTVTDAGGRPLSSVLSFHFRDQVMPYYAGDDPAARALAANDFKYWALMRRACEHGFRLFDYGRSKAGTGPWAFKKNWGFEPQPLAYEYRLYKRDAVPQHNPLNPRYRAFIALWRHLPLGVANALGPHIVRNLG
jgi:FemAB-related protein (PEP-CTERM system-associated)